MNELNDYLLGIAQNSMQGEIPWTQPNPSTFLWLQEQDDIAYQVTIQKAGEVSKNALRGYLRQDITYMFQVQDRSNKQIVISLSTNEKPEVYDALEAIFHGAEKGIDVRTTNVLRKLLGKRKSINNE